MEKVSLNLDFPRPFVALIDEQSGMLYCCDKRHLSGYFTRKELNAIIIAAKKALELYDEEKLTDEKIQEFDNEEIRKELERWNNVAQQTSKVKKEKKDDLYLILDNHNNLLKIGRSKNVRARLKQHQTSCGRPLTLLYHIKGKGDMEQSLLERFSQYRTSGEWFANKKEIVNVFNKLSKKGGNVC